ncbi:ExbD/TolR family protein [Massilibacteroides vaginae]|uniref:ExbD/TolR family protein n=1 Tax=Massilibacteroides vaginae TaxID=1673718 RepID=UPI000A1CEC9D|nr:biopolymer transporter ExbD [Massilibacteroides vaginae]
MASKRKQKKMPALSTTSSADIAFMILLFFLLTTSMDTDMGLARRLPPPVPKDQKNTDIDIKKRNLMVVLINTNNQILCNGQFVEVNQLKELVKEFIANPFNDEHKPEKTEVDVPFYGKMMVTKNHIISLQNDRGTEYQAYINVQNELAAAYNELRNDVSKEKFGRVFDELDEEQQKAVQMIYPQKISEAEPKNYGGK